MKHLVDVFQVTLMLLVTGICSAVAQETEITSKDFQAYLKRSNEITKTGSFRRIVTVEKGDSPMGDWGPYSSWTDESVFPDRLHLSYKTPSQEEYFRIGKTKYSKDAAGLWTGETTDVSNVVSSPSAPQGIGDHDRITSYYTLRSNDFSASSILIKVVSRLKDETADAEKKTYYYSYWFDDEGVLYKHEQVGFNGINWVHRTEIYEYDPTIKIEIPIK